MAKWHFFDITLKQLNSFSRNSSWVRSSRTRKSRETYFPAIPRFISSRNWGGRAMCLRLQQVKVSTVEERNVRTYKQLHSWSGYRGLPSSPDHSLLVYYNHTVVGLWPSTDLELLCSPAIVLTQVFANNDVTVTVFNGIMDYSLLSSLLLSIQN